MSKIIKLISKLGESETLIALKAISDDLLKSGKIYRGDEIVVETEYEGNQVIVTLDGNIVGKYLNDIRPALEKIGTLVSDEHFDSCNKLILVKKDGVYDLVDAPKEGWDVVQNFVSCDEAKKYVGERQLKLLSSLTSEEQKAIINNVKTAVTLHDSSELLFDLDNKENNKDMVKTEDLLFSDEELNQEVKTENFDDLYFDENQEVTTENFDDLYFDNEEVKTENFDDLYFDDEETRQENFDDLYFDDQEEVTTENFDDLYFSNDEVDEHHVENFDDLYFDTVKSDDIKKVHKILADYAKAGKEVVVSEVAEKAGVDERTVKFAMNSFKSEKHFDDLYFDTGIRYTYLVKAPRPGKSGPQYERVNANDTSRINKLKSEGFMEIFTGTELEYLHRDQEVGDDHYFDDLYFDLGDKDPEKDDLKDDHASTSYPEDKPLDKNDEHRIDDPSKPSVETKVVIKDAPKDEPSEIKLNKETRDELIRRLNKEHEQSTLLGAAKASKNKII